jgi:hypothetical protein
MGFGNDLSYHLCCGDRTASTTKRRVLARPQGGSALTRAREFEMNIPHPFRVVADLRDATGYLVVGAPYAGPIIGKTKTIREQRIAIYDCGRTVERARVSDARLLSVAAVLRFKYPEIFALIYALMFDRGDLAAVVPPTTQHYADGKLIAGRMDNTADDASIQRALEDACATALIHDAWRPEIRYFADWEHGADWRFSTFEPFKSAPAPSLPDHVCDSVHALDSLFALGACKNGSRLEVPDHEWPRASSELPLRKLLA